MSNTPNKPADKPQAPDTTAPATGAGTTAAAVPAVGSDTKDAQIAALQAQLAAVQAQQALGQIQAAQVPAIAATFTAPTAELIPKHDSVTGLVQQLPAKLWDLLSDEDKERFTPYVAEKPTLKVDE